ncbi:MAG: hypothetical protein MIO93_12925, partial [ANME-2 cluster archaeon]|nr:hypothetical protein [ANME-2 cluster archaeon]
AGAPVSDAGIRMNVTAPEGSVGYFSTITGSIVENSDPGVYEAAYLTGGEGQYNISCTAIIEGSESQFDTYFMVLSEYDFDIIRHAQSKIDPTEYDTFDVTIDITSYTDADTITIWEYVPANFKVYSDAVLVEADNLKVLTWQRSLVNNRTSVNYSYSVPMEWPKLYQLGPVEVDYGNKTFTEARPWWVAVDPTVHTYDFSTGAGSDKWAYWKENEGSIPPSGGPTISGEAEFTSYTEIASSDTSRYSTTITRNYYATHHFKFNITENPSTITNIFVLWEGFGTDNSSYLYIWNAPGWELVGSGSSESSDNIISTNFAANFDDYIDANGFLHLVSTSQRTASGSSTYYLRTDYVKVNVTYTPAGAPTITSYAPATVVSDVEGAARTFNTTVNQTVDVSWQINGTEVSTNTSVTNANYTNNSAEVGYWNVSAIVTNANGNDIQTWWWTVSVAPGATSWWNNKTNNDSLTLTINVSEEIEFGIVYDQTGNITWNATDYTDRSNLSVLSGNQTYNWSTSGTKYLNASMNNTNGTSSITQWSIIV